MQVPAQLSAKQGEKNSNSTERIIELLTEGVGNSGKVPKGLLTAPGIEKKLEGIDFTAPIISDVKATSTVASTTLITWNTDEDSISIVHYGTSTGIYTDIAIGSTTATSSMYLHEVELYDLPASTTYYFYVESEDGAGNVAVSQEYIFITTNSNLIELIPNTRITYEEGGSVFPSIAAGVNEYLIAYSDDCDGAEPEIYISRLDFNGLKNVNDLRISVNPATISYNPVIVFNGSGYGLLWSEYYRSSSEGALLFANLDLTGAVIGDIATVTEDAYGITPSQPDMVWDGTNYAITWSENRAGTETSQIYFKKIGVTGNSLTADVKLTQAISGRGNPSIVWTGEEYALAWQDLRDAVVQTGPDSWVYYNTAEIYFVKVDNNENKMGDENRITFTPDHSGGVNLHWNGIGFDMTWLDYGDIGIRDVYFCKLDEDGLKLTGDVKITNMTDNGGDYAASPFSVANGNIYGVAWLHNGGNVEFVEIDIDGNLLGDETVVSNSGTARELNLVRSSENYGFAWMDYRDQNSGEEIYFDYIQ
ncbi:fibronectin type III domain-containing protein [Candidatus Parcubacteria bacterium]|nr:fibronectin type III domain-containing protein [Candidatus Parcubacteria bacterium]